MIPHSKFIYEGIIVLSRFNDTGADVKKENCSYVADKMYIMIEFAHSQIKIIV